MVEVWGAVVRQAPLPIGGELAGLLRDGVDVVGQREGDDIRSEAVDHGARLLAGTAVRLLDNDIVAGL